jgi:glucan phosphorylase
MPPDNQTDVAYFSMQIAVDPAWPTYARGPGVLAGDILRPQRTWVWPSRA